MALRKEEKNKPQKCIDCGCVLTPTNRFKNKNARGWRLCAKCNNLRARETHKKVKKETGKNYYKIYQRRSTLKCRYGLTLEQYNQMFDEQNGGCAICGGLNSDGRSLHVDHNHETGKIRGLLCGNCNRKLQALEDVDFYKKARKYLKKAGE